MIPTTKLKKLRAFHGDAQLKKDLLSEIVKHQKQDQIIKGTYGVEDEGEKFKACAVGCSIHSLNISKGKTLDTDNHSAYESEFGIPESLAHLEDFLFENMPNDKAQKWVAEFIRAIPVGADLSLVAPRFIASTLRDLLKIKEVKADKDVAKSVLDIAILWEKIVAGEVVEKTVWSAALSAAKSAARSAACSAARSAARSAALSAALSAAKSAAWFAALSADRSAARSAASYKMSRRLLKIMRSTKNLDI